MSDIFILYLWISYWFALGGIVEQINKWSDISFHGWLYLILAPAMAIVKIGRDWR